MSVPSRHAENQTRLTRYDADNRVAEVSYLNARLATPTVSFKYDAVHGRVTEMTDGSGVTTYGYHPAGGLGAGRLAAVDGPLADDTLSYTYDALGRVLSRSVHGAANRVTVENYDAAGRVTEGKPVRDRLFIQYRGEWEADDCGEPIAKPVRDRQFIPGNNESP